MNKSFLTLVALTMAVSANVNVNAAGQVKLHLDEVQEDIYTDADGLTLRKFSVKPKSDTAPLWYTPATKAAKEAEQAELNRKAAALARSLQKQHDAAYAQAVQDAKLPLSRRVVRAFTLGKTQVGPTSVAVPVGIIKSGDPVDAISTRVLSTRVPKLKTEIVNTKVAAQTAALTQAINATQAIVAPGVKPAVSTASRTARFAATLKNHKGKIAAGTVTAIALALGAYYGIPAYQAYSAMKAFEATYWGKIATTLAKAPFVPANPRGLIKNVLRPFHYVGLVK